MLCRKPGQHTMKLVFLGPMAEDEHLAWIDRLALQKVIQIHRFTVLHGRAAVATPAGRRTLDRDGLSPR